jgi:hypothetical protein
MRKAVIVVLTILCAIFLFGRGPGGANPAVRAAAWTSLGPYGGDIVGLARNPKSPSELYAASSSYPSQVFRSTNNGTSWVRQSIILQRVYDLAIDPKTPSTLYLLSDSYIHVSKDKGKTFSNFRLPDNFQAYSGRIAVHPTNPKIILVAGYYYYDTVNWHDEIAVARTTNGGATWTLKRLSQQTEYGYGCDIEIAKSNPNYIYLCGYDYTNSTSSARVYVSKNGGTSWASVGNSAAFASGFPSCYSVLIDPRDPKKAWVGHYAGIARTTNAGGSWKAQQSSQIVYVMAIAADSSNPNILYAGGKYNNVFSSLKSTDGGVTWKAYSDGLYGESRRILAAGAKVHQATQAGIFLSKNGGSTWKPSHTGIRAANIGAFAVAPSSPNTIYTGIYGYAMFKTTNGGAVWTPCSEFTGSNLVASILIDPSNPNSIYVKPSG